MDAIEKFKQKLKQKSVDLKMKSTQVTGKPRKLKTTWAMEKPVEMKHEVGDGVMEEITNIIDQEIVEAIMKEVKLEEIREKIRNAPD
jgi:hypothetical protein